MKLRTVNNYHLQDEPADEVGQKYAYAEDVVLTIRGREYRLKSGHGTSDNLFVYRNADTYYVFVLNTRFPYAGIASYTVDANLDHTEPIMCDGEVFGQEGELDDLLGDRDAVDNLTPITLAKRMIEWLGGN